MYACHAYVSTMTGRRADSMFPQEGPGIFYHVSDVEGREKVERT